MPTNEVDILSSKQRRDFEKREREKRNEAVQAIADMMQEFGAEWIVQRVSDQLTFAADECAGRERSQVLRIASEDLQRAANGVRILLGGH